MKEVLTEDQEETEEMIAATEVVNGCEPTGLYELEGEPIVDEELPG